MDNKKLYEYVFRGGGKLVITSLPDNIHRQFTSDELDAAYDYVMEQGKATNVYLNPNPRRDNLPPGVRGSDDDIISVTAFVADIDVLGPAHKEQNLPPTKQDAMDVFNDLPAKPSFIVDSGYGLYAYYIFENPIDTMDDGRRKYVAAIYKGFGKHLKKVFAEKGWKIDPVFNLSHMFRAPGSLNHKLDSGKPECRVIADNGIFYSLEDFEEFYEELEPEHTPFEVDERVVGSAFRILDGCKFTRKLVEEPNAVTEPEWKYALSNIALAKDGAQKAHEWSSLYDGYSYDETQAKVEQCQKAKKPCTCAYIQCQTGFNCPEGGCGVKAPVVFSLLSKEEQIASYTVITESRDTSAYSGNKKWWTPNENSTCIVVPKSETQLFEDYILKPYFDITKEELLKNDASGLRYWFLNANPKIWSMSSMPIGEVQDYTLYNDNGNKRRIFQNFLDAKAGDMVIGYESTPVKQIVAILRVSAEQDGQKIYFEKVEGLSSPIDFSTLKECSELEKMEYFSMTQGSLFKLTRGEYDFIIDMIREENPAPSGKGNTEYTKTDFLREVYMTEAKYDRLAAVLKKKKNIILQGAPGVGKTFAAKRLAYSVMGEKDDDRIEFVQFHQNYSYEDFMMGYKPVENGFELKYGIFYRFCQKAANHPDKDYFFIIDEINRGNMSKIFGELLMLIEADYRDKKATLAYNGLSFSVPKRLHIIGMMNTADRSLAMIDYALRRRFSFFDMEPGFDSEGFINYQNSFANETFNTLIERIKELNKEIAQDKSLGKGFCIGHSYFCNADDCTEEWMKDVVDFDILPMLSEYWFDESSKLQRWENILHGVFQ